MPRRAPSTAWRRTTFAGDYFTVTVNVWVAVPREFLAVNVSVYVPATVGVPDRVAVPLPLFE